MSGYSPGPGNYPHDPNGEYGLNPQASGPGQGGGYGGQPVGGPGAGGVPQQPGQFGPPPGQPGQFGAPPGQYGQPPSQQPPSQQYAASAGGYSGQPGPQPGPAAPYPPGFGQQPPSPKKKSPLGLILGLVGGIIVLSIIGGVAVLVLVINNKPDDMVEKYFAALAAGNAQEALSYAETKPTDTTFLTDEVLKKSNTLGAISDVEVMNSSNNMVRVTMKIGTEATSVTYRVSKTDDGWKLAQVAWPLAFVETTKNAPLFINDVEAKDTKSILVFPGTYELGAGTKNLAWAKPEQVVTGGLLQTTQLNRLEITDEGKKSAKSAIRKWFDVCLERKELEPKGCPFRLKSLDGTVDTKTIQWSASPHPAEVWAPSLLTDATKVSGRIAYQIHLKFNYINGGKKYVYDRTAALSLTVTADLTKESVKINWDT